MKKERKLEGRTILLVQHEELCAMVLAGALQEAGARVVTCSSPGEGLRVLSAGSISAAVIEHASCGGDDGICRRLDAEDVPYVLHNGLIEVHGTRGDRPEQEVKPVSADGIVTEVVSLLATR